MENKPQYNQTIEKRQTKLKEALINTLKEMPIIEVAVKRIGIGRDTYYRWKNQDKDFLKRSQEAMMRGIEFINDLSESQIIALIKDKKMSSIKFWLRHNHPKYKEKIEITTNTQPQEELNPEQASIVKEALRLSSVQAEEVEVEEEYQPSNRKNVENSNESPKPEVSQTPTGPKVVTPAEFAKMTGPIKEPITVKSPQKEVTYFPNGEVRTKFANGSTVYSPPDPDREPPLKPTPLPPEPNNIFRTEAW
jgi:hypothetical protein